MNKSGKEKVFQSWLHKQSRFLKQWRLRFGVLTNTHMMTFDKEHTNQEPTEMILLKNCNGVKSCDDETKKENSFRIDYQGSIFYFFCNTKGEKDKWIGSISKIISQDLV